MEEYGGYVGLDVHKDTIAIVIASAGRSKPKSLGIIANTKKSVLKLVGKLSPHGEVLRFCYETGPCGYEVYRWIKQTGHECDVVAPAKIPKKAGERVKTDRRDAVKLASFYRSGELTSVWVPDEEQDAMRDLSRARAEMERIEPSRTLRSRRFARSDLECHRLSSRRCLHKRLYTPKRHRPSLYNRSSRGFADTNRPAVGR